MPDTMQAPKPERPTSSSRPPSLNQLAARINSNAGNTSNPSPLSTTSTSRPRLAASLLRTGSTTSLSTVASTTDSLVVNAPSTRSVSPAASITPPHSSTPSIPENAIAPGDPLTTERLKELNHENTAQNTNTIQAPKPQVKVGYKNIPSLDAITARLAKARSLSVDGSAKPPEAQMIEDPKTPGIQMKAPEHPLQYVWTIYHDSKSRPPFAPTPVAPTPSSAASSESGISFPAPPESGEYEAGLTVIGDFSTVESFCRYFNWLKPPSKLERNSNYHLFKSGIKPMWEDPSNANGGKWVLTMKNNPALLDRCWSWLAMALVGEELEGEGGAEGGDICGAVVSLRSKVDRIQVWTRGKDDVERLNGIGKKLVKLLDVSEADSIGLEFQYNTDDRPLPNKFLSIQAMPTTSYRSTFGAGVTGKSFGPGGGAFGGGGVFGGGSNAGTPVSETPISAGGAFGGFGKGRRG